MLAIFVLIASLVAIAVAWGLVPLVVVILAALFVSYVGKPEYSSDANWGGLIANVGICLLGVGAVNTIWHEPVYNGVAVLLIILAHFTDL